MLRIDSSFIEDASSIFASMPHGINYGVSESSPLNRCAGEVRYLLVRQCEVSIDATIADEWLET